MRIAQITDLHLRQHLPGTAANNARRSRRMAELFPIALQQARQQGADLVAITGDLLDVPAWVNAPIPGFIMDPIQPWRDAAVRDYQLLRDLLQQAGLPYMVLPGNHDDDASMWQVFDAADEVRDIAGHRVARFCDYEHDGHVPRRFIPARQLFKQLLADESSPPQVHLQHYVLTPTLNEGYPHTYGEAESMLGQIAAAGPRVRLCLSGHYHEGTDLLQHGQTWFSTGPAFCVWPHRWRLYDVTDCGVSMSEFAVASAPARRPVVFVDRDGVINDLASYAAGPERMRLLPGAAEGIRRLQQAGYAIVVVSAQGGIGIGNVPLSVVQATNDAMHRLLAEGGATLDGVYFSQGAGDDAVLPQYVDLSDAKPKATLLHRAAEQLHLDLRGAWMVGDRVTDVQTALNGGVEPVLVRTGYGAAAEPRLREQGLSAAVVDDLRAAAALILERRESGVTSR